jgi:hypothetical protein
VRRGGRQRRWGSSPPTPSWREASSTRVFPSLAAFSGKGGNEQQQAEEESVVCWLNQSVRAAV